MTLPLSYSREPFTTALRAQRTNACALELYSLTHNGLTPVRSHVPLYMARANFDCVCPDECGIRKKYDILDYAQRSRAEVVCAADDFSPENDSSRRERAAKRTGGRVVNGSRL